MKNKRLFIGFLIIVMLFAGGLGISYRTAIAAEFSDILAKFQIIFDVYQIINSYYVDEVDTDKVIEGALKGMADELDPYSVYLDKEAYEEMQTDLIDGVFGGVGIVITIIDNQLTIVSPIKDTPGAEAGLQSGDKVLKIDGKSTEGLSTVGASKLMKGEPGTEVVLTVQREDSKPEDVVIVRGLIEVPYLDYEMLDGGIGYLNLYEFGNGVGTDIADALEDLDNQGLNGIILDLRSNPGGILQEAVNVASNFITKGPVVRVRQRDDLEETLTVNRLMKHYQLPMIVLVDGGSASASEIVAGAIQDTGVGKLLGTTTFGKGTVQSIIPLDNGAAFKVTIARYYTPNGRFIHENGIEPDITLEFDIDKYKEDETDNQLEKAIELLEQQIADQNAEKAIKPAS